MSILQLCSLFFASLFIPAVSAYCMLRAAAPDSRTPKRDVGLRHVLVFGAQLACATTTVVLLEMLASVSFGGSRPEFVLCLSLLAFLGTVLGWIASFHVQLRRIARA